VTSAQDYLQSPDDEWHLGCLLVSVIGREWLPIALEKVDPEDFYNPVLGMVWAAGRVVHARGDRVTKRTLLAECVDQAVSLGFPGRVGSVTGRVPKVPAVKAFLDQVSGEPVYVDQIPGNIERVRHTARMRRLVQTLERAREHVVTAGDYPQALEITHELLGGLEEADTPDDAVPFRELLSVFEKTMAAGGVGGDVIPTPWPGLNELMLGGLYPGRTCVIGAQAGDGKSIAGLDIARSAAEQGFPSLVVSVEMDGLEVTGRALASGARVEYSEIARWSVSEDTAWAVTQYSDQHRDMPLWVCDRPDMTVERIAALAGGVSKRHGLALLVIDYLQLLEAPDRGRSREQVVAQISRSVTLLGKRLGVAVVVLAQLNRDNAKTNRRPTKHDLRESGALGQNSHYVLLLHHEKAPDGSPTGMMTLILDKNRHGRTGDVDVRWRGHQARIGD
jgi:replicative DNA helicase